MLKNFTRIAYRNILHKPTFLVINVAGLSVGLACCVLVALFGGYESNYDSNYNHGDQLYQARVVLEGRDVGMNMPVSVIDKLPSLYPEVEQVSSYSWFHGNMYDLTVLFADKSFVDPYIWVDHNFFTLLGMSFISGDPGSALVAPDSVVITRSQANKYFGRTNVVGEVLNIYNNHYLTVTGVIDDLPVNSHLKAKLYVSANSDLVQPKSNTRAELKARFSLLKLSDGSSTKPVEEALFAALDAQYPGRLVRLNMKVALRPISQIHLDEAAIQLTRNHDNGFSLIKLSNGRVVFFAQLLAAFVLLVSVVNFVNMNMARASYFHRDIATRKTLGANSWQLLVQYLSEALLLSVVALVVAFILVWVLLPYFADLTSRPFLPKMLLDRKLVFSGFLLSLVVGAIASIYPALILARKSPAMLRGSSPEMNRGLFRRVLVVVQFGIVALLIAVAIVASQQVDLLRQKNLGYDPAVYQVSPVSGSSNKFTGKNTSGFYVSKIRMRLLALPEVKDISFPARFNCPGEHAVYMEHYTLNQSSSQNSIKAVSPTRVDSRFLSTYKIELLVGESFSNDNDFSYQKSDQESNEIILTASTARKLGLIPFDRALNQVISIGSPADGGSGGSSTESEPVYRVIGVCDDFLLGDGLEGSLGGGLIVGNSPDASFIVRVTGQDHKAAFDRVMAELKRVVPELVYVSSYLPSKLELAIRPFQKLMQVFIGFTLLAIVIACMGLYAATAFNVERRTKEVAIRKVMGAGVGRLVRLLGWDFTRPVLLSLLLALPVAYIVCNYLLQSFSFRVPVGFVLLSLTAMLTLLIAWLTVIGLTLLAANADPSESLRSE